jgi:hypothetical protein
MHMKGGDPQSESCVHGDPTDSFCALVAVPLPLLLLLQATANTTHPAPSVANREIILPSSDLREGRDCLARDLRVPAIAARNKARFEPLH